MSLPVTTWRRGGIQQHLKPEFESVTDVQQSTAERRKDATRARLPLGGLASSEAEEVRAPLIRPQVLLAWSMVGLGVMAWFFRRWSL